MLYLETSLLSEPLIGPAVDRPIVPDRSLRGAVSALHDLLGCADDALEAETRLAFVAERVRAGLGDVPPDPGPRTRTRSPSSFARCWTRTSSSR